MEFYGFPVTMTLEERTQKHCKCLPLGTLVVDGNFVVVVGALVVTVGK